MTMMKEHQNNYVPNELITELAKNFCKICFCLRIKCESKMPCRISFLSHKMPLGLAEGCRKSERDW